MEEIFDWIKSHFLELGLAASLALGIVYIRVRSIQTKINGKNNNSQIAAGDIKNSNIRGNKNKVNIK